MSRKISRKGLIKKMDSLVSKYVISRDKRCVLCASTRQLGNGHLFSRRHFSTRWDTQEDGNCQTQCWPCNFKHVRNTYPYQNWYINKFGKSKYDALYRRWNSVSRMTMPQLREKLEKLPLAK